MNMFRPVVLGLFLSIAVCLAQLDTDSDYAEEVPSTHKPHILSSTTLLQAMIGESVTFPCDVDDLGDFVLIWRKGKNRMLHAGPLKISRDERINVLKDNTTLVINSIHPKDSGEYFCQISTNPPLELSHTLDVLYPPSIKPHAEKRIVVKEGESATLSCIATGNPKPDITWRHGDRTYDNSDMNSYHITSARKEDSGKYECIADNSVGEPATAKLEVEVVSAPKVYPDPKSGLLVVKEGEPIKISCETEGDPMPTISWKTPGGNGPMKQREENKIVISEADRNHAGHYECIANNSLGISASAIIRVQVLFTPEIQVPHPWVHAGEGTNVNISCVIRGEPTPSVMWKKADGHVIHNSEHYHLSSNSNVHILQIKQLMEEDFGRYECVASNSLSSSSENVHIIGTPQVPIFTSKPHGSQGTKYTLSWTVHSHTPVDEYSLMYRKKGNGDWESKTIPATDKEDDAEHVQMFQLDDLEPATSYEAVVTARNKFGWSKQSDALVFSTKKEEWTTPATEEPTVPSTVLEYAENEKVSEQISSKSSSAALSLVAAIPLVFVSFYRSLL